MEDIPPPPGWAQHQSNERNLLIEPPPGWNHQACNVKSSNRPRKRKRRENSRGHRWASVGRNNSKQMLRVEILFELYQMLAFTTEEELSEACISREQHDRKKNPWRVVQEPLNRIQRLLASKGRHSPALSSRSFPFNLAQKGNGVRSALKKGMHRLEDTTLAFIHSYISDKFPRVKANRVCEVDPEEFLPVDLWVRVLSFLEFNKVWGNLSRVNRAWFQVVSSKRYWSSLRQIKLSNGFPQIRELSVFFHRMHNLKRADFGAEVSPGSSWLTIRTSQINDHVIRHLAACKQLETLDLSRCERISDQGFLFIAGSCHHLKALCLTDCTGITDRSLNQISFGCPSLEVVSLKGCYQITDKGLESLSSGCARLKTVILRRCRYITDQGVMWLAARLPNLAQLDVYSCHRITDLSLKHLGQNCPNLETLILGGCQKVSDRGLRILIKGCQKLQKLDLFQTKVTLEGIITAATLPRLLSLNLHNTSITQKDLAEKKLSFRTGTQIFI